MFHFPSLLYVIGSAVCAQRTSHSFFYKGEQLPLGSRWTGITLGIFTVILFWFLTRKSQRSSPPRWSIVITSLIFVIYFAFDSFSSVFEANYVNNFTRLFSGLLFGLAIGIYLILILNHGLWQNYETKEPIISWKEFFVLILTNSLFFFAFFYNIQPFLYLSAFISIISLVIFIFSFNFIVILLIPKYEKCISKKFIKIEAVFLSIALTLLEFSLLISLRSLTE